MALINAQMMHTNLNTTFYTHVEHSSTKTIYMKYDMENTHIRTHTLTVAKTGY